VRRFEARAEFRRADPLASWSLAGVVIDHRFWPAQPGLEAFRGRRREPGLLAWADLPTPIVAADEDTAAAIALDVARRTWPKPTRRD
jgi:hypothetical protein